MNVLTTQEGLSQLDQAISKMRKNIAEHIGAVLDATFPTVEIPENIYKLLLEVFSDMEGVFYPESAAKYLLASGAMASGFPDTTPFAILRSGDPKQIDLISRNLGNIMAGNCA